ncbi:helix-turn-helix domain-containing protein [Amycolatopsis sp. cmx-11-51]|uniref:helix-turn-helix domain-containing protein n=1 Tax=Amycolatopsis sp. cmx-11-51 TaxID=2785797 RepID=UPI0039E50050
MVAKRHGLVSARKAAGFSQESLAEALRVASSSVSNWERGKTEPVPYKRPKLAKLLDITASELEALLHEGIGEVLPAPIVPSKVVVTPRNDATFAAFEIPPQYKPSLDGALVSLATLAHVDESGVANLPASAFAEDLPAQAILSWLVGAAYNDVRSSGSPVVIRDIDEIVTTTKALDQLDRQFGGDYSRGLAVKYLSGRVMPLLRSPSSTPLRRELFQAAAVLCEVIGYMAYDGQLHGLARHYFVQALRLVKEADNPTYGSFVLATMSHQALYLDRPDHALTLAQSAQHHAGKKSVPAVAAEAAMLEAVAFAALGDRSSSTQALGRAEASFHRHGAVADVPYWVAHWDDAVFASFASTACLDLGDTAAAAPYLEVLWENAHHQVRRQVFAAGQLAKAALLEREVERAVHYGTMAVEAAAAAKSKRSRRIVRDLLVQLDGHRQLAPVRELTSKAVALLPSEAL